MLTSQPANRISSKNREFAFSDDLFARMSLLQEPGALLFLGHSESLFKVCTDYSLIGTTIYRRV